MSRPPDGGGSESFDAADEDGDRSGRDAPGGRDASGGRDARGDDAPAPGEVEAADEMDRVAVSDPVAVRGQLEADEPSPGTTDGRARAAVTLPRREKGTPGPIARLRARVAGSASGGTMLVLALLVGLVTGLLAVGLIQVVRLVQSAVWGPSPGFLRILLIPAVGGVVVGLVVRYYAPETGGGGIAAVMTSIALQGGRMRPRVPLTKLLVSGVSLGTGASGGREGPIVQIGGGIASLVGRLVALDEERKRTLIAAGTAAGIGASFNAPIAGMLFAIEIIVRSYSVRSIQVIVVASVAASVTARQILGDSLIYRPAEIFSVGGPQEYVLYAGLGLAAVALGIMLARGEHLVWTVTSRWSLSPPVLTGLGGLAVGILALGMPEILGSGDGLPPIAGAEREPILAMLSGGFGTGWAAAGFLLLLAIVKTCSTSISIGTGSSVGFFTPAVFIGAALGGAFGHAAEVLLPGQQIQPGAYALVGMAAVLGSSSRAPLTGILLAFELTSDYELVLPLMLATGIATFVAERLDPESIDTLPLTRRGIVYSEPEDIDIMQTVQVGEIMTSEPDRLDVDASLPEVLDLFAATGNHGFPVVRDHERLVGVVTLSDLRRGDPDALDHEPTAGDLATRRPLTVTPQDPVFRAMRRMGSLDVGRLPVVDATDHGRLVGMVRRRDLVTAYQRAVTRSLGVQRRKDQSRLRDLGGARFVELTVATRAPAANRAVREIDWPARTVLTAVQRRGELVMPRGDTVLRPGDAVTVLADGDLAEDVRKLLRGEEQQVGGT